MQEEVHRARERYENLIREYVIYSLIPLVNLEG